MVKKNHFEDSQQTAVWQNIEAFRHFLGSSHREDDQAGLRGISGIVYNDLDILLIKAQYSKSTMNSRSLQSSFFEMEMANGKSNS